MGAADFSLVPGFACAVGDKGKKKRSQIRKIWASEARPAAAQRWPPFLLPRLPLGSLRSPIFAPMGSLVPGLNMNS